MTRNKDVEILNRERRYDGYLKIDEYRLRHRLHEGGWSAPVSRELLERGHAAAVLPYDPARDEVVFIEQFRIGALAAGWDPWLTEIVAGIIGEGESAEDVARREAKEEAGLEIGEMARAGAVLLTPGACSETAEIFVGRTDATEAGGVHGLDDENEDILVRTLSYAEAERRLHAGALSNAIITIAMQWLALNRADLRRRWT